MRVSGLGQCSLDLLAAVPNYPALNEKAEVRTWDEQGGGPVATALVTLQRLGVATAFFGLIGDDVYGIRIRESLDRAGVDTSGLITRRGLHSQISFIAVDERSGERTIFCRRLSGPRATLPELTPQDFEKSDPLGQCSLLLLDGVMNDISIEVAGRAKAQNIPVLLDAGRVRARTIELCGLCAHVVGSEVFAEQLGWAGDSSGFLPKARQLGCPVLTLTFGTRGSVTYAFDQPVPRFFKTPAFPVKTVDTTGAGDVFHGAYAYGVLQGWALEKTTRFASAAAALKCTRLGGRAGIPTLEQITDFLK